MTRIAPPGSPSVSQPAIPNQPVTVSAPPAPTGFPGQTPFAMPSPNLVGINTAANTPETLYPPVPEKLLPVTIGDPGTMRYGGFFREEYEPFWNNNEERVDIVEQMRRGDARVAQLLKAVKAPMLACEFDIECASDDPKDQKIVEFVKENLFSMPGRTWKEFFRQSLTDLDFGYSVFEICWKLDKGRFWIQDLAPRIQHSILRFKLSDGSRGIVQILRTDEAKNYYVEIPIRKCLVFTNDMEGNDITGIPLLRYCYKHWYMKNQLYTIANISAERFGVGTPIITLPEGSSPQDFTAAQGIVQNFRSNESSGVVLPNDKWKLDILVPKGRSSAGMDIKDQIEHHDLMILQAGLCAFLNLGTTDTGSFALSSDARGFFLTYVQDRMSHRCEQINDQVIKPLLELNNLKPSKPIRLTFSNLGDKDKVATSQWISALAQAGLLKMDSKLMNWAAKYFGLPELTEDDLAMMDIAEIEKNMPPMPNAAGQEELPPEPDAEQMSDEFELFAETPSLEDLIAEHKRLVAIMKSGDLTKIRAEADKQEKELEKYEKEEA